MAAPFSLVVGQPRKRPAPPSEAGSDHAVTQQDRSPDPQPAGAWVGVVEVRHKKQKRDDDDEPSESEVICEQSPKQGQDQDVEMAEDTDGEADEGVQSQAPKRIPATYRGEEYTTASKCFKATKLQAFYERTETYLEHYLDDILCPRWPEGDRKKEMDWSLDLINRLTDLQFMCDDCAEFNALLHAEVGERYRLLKWTPPPQILKKEVERVLDRKRSEGAMRLASRIQRNREHRKGV